MHRLEALDLNLSDYTVIVFCPAEEVSARVGEGWEQLVPPGTGDGDAGSAILGMPRHPGPGHEPHAVRKPA